MPHEDSVTVERYGIVTCAHRSRPFVAHYRCKGPLAPSTAYPDAHLGRWPQCQAARSRTRIQVGCMIRRLNVYLQVSAPIIPGSHFSVSTARTAGRASVGQARESKVMMDVLSS